MHLTCPCRGVEEVRFSGPFGKAFQRPRVSTLQADDQIRTCYEHTMAEWLGCEAIVRQREKESHAAALAKCSSGASLDSHIQRMMHRDSTISNEVRVRGLREGCPTQGRGLRVSLCCRERRGQFLLVLLP